jgi:hypothetical protein
MRRSHVLVLMCDLLSNQHDRFALTDTGHTGLYHYTEGLLAIFNARNNIC